MEMVRTGRIAMARGEVDPATVGALIAFYEHRVYANAVMMGINPFDQFGVELGKEIARSPRLKALLKRLG